MLGLIIGIVGIVSFGIYGGYQAKIYFTGESTTAHVTRCHSEMVSDEDGDHRETTCYGTWHTAAGRSYSGVIDGLDDPGAKGSDQHVRVSGRTALLADPKQLWPLFPAAFCLLFTVFMLFQLPVAFGRLRGGQYPWQPSGYPPPPTGQGPPSGGYPTPRR